ncbi:MAG: RagB/SusD family nutrient uptake outer membrane protein [Parabacteroides merdae]
MQDYRPWDKSVYVTHRRRRAELYRRERRGTLFENKRYDDIRRWGIGTETMSGPIYGAWNPNDEAFVLIETRACVFPKYDSWPLPQQEETANSNIKQTCQAGDWNLKCRVS